jgi:hypothetical protein
VLTPLALGQRKSRRGDDDGDGDGGDGAFVRNPMP